MSEGELFSRDEVMGGLSARRARALLFLIDQHSARHAAAREVGPMTYGGERKAEARELEAIEHFALGREPTKQPTIQEIEQSAESWAPFVPKAASIRAGTALLIDERYDLERKLLPRTTAALGLDDPRVAEAYQRLTGNSIDVIWTGVGPVERLRWAAAAPGHWLEETTPVRAAAALTFLLSMGQTVVVVPIAVAAVGPIAALISIVVIGLLAVSATAAISEAAARSGEIRFRGGFFGRLVVGALGPAAGGLPSALGSIGVVLAHVSALVGLGLLLGLLLPIPAVVCVLAVGALSTLAPLRGERTAASFGGLLSFGIVSIALVTLLSVLVLVLALIEGNFDVPALGLPEGVGIEAGLGIILGILISAYADPVYAVQIGRIVLPRDPDGRGLIRGSMIGMAAYVGVTAAFSAVIILVVPPASVAGVDGSALDPLTTEYGIIASVLAGIIGIALFGIRLYGNGLALYDLVEEQLPGSSPITVVLGVRRGRVLLSRRDGSSTPAVVLAYRGQRSGSPVIAISRTTDHGVETRETALVAGPTLAEEEVGIRVLSADDERLRLELDTPMAISYDDASGLLGGGVAETLLAEDGSGALAAWLLRGGGASPREAAEYLEVPEAEARERLEALVAAGSAREVGDGRYEAQIAARRKRGAGLGDDLWDRIGEPGDPEEDSAPEAESARRAFPPFIANVLCSVPNIALTAISAALVAAGTASVSTPIKIAGIICIATIAGVLPPLLLLALRRRSDIAGAASGGALVAVPLLAFMLVFSVAVLILHATIFWTEPIEKALAALASVTAFVMIWFSIRNGSFRSAMVVDLREEHDQPGLRVVAERDGAEQNPRLSLGDRELSAGARAELTSGMALSVEGPAAEGGELRISAQNIDALGASAALPLEVELKGIGSGEVRRLGESGGATVFELGEEAADWTLVFRRPAEPGADSAEPQEAPAKPPGSGRRRGGGESPLDQL